MQCEIVDNQNKLIIQLIGNGGFFEKEWPGVQPGGTTQLISVAETFYFRWCPAYMSYYAQDAAAGHTLTLGPLIDGYASTYHYYNTNCVHANADFSVEEIPNKITNEDGIKQYYCADEKISLTLPYNAELVQWKVGNTNDPVAMKNINLSTTRSLEVDAKDIANVGVNPNETFYFYAVATYGDLTDVRSDVKGQFRFTPAPPIPKIRVQAPSCYGEKGKLTLSDFKYTDGTTYAGNVAIDITIQGQQTTEVQCVKLNGVGTPDPGGCPYIAGTEISWDVSPDTYNVYVSFESADCEKTLISATVPVAPSRLEVTAAESCSNGAPLVTVDASGGTPGYLYGTSNSGNGSSNIFSELTPSTGYTFYVTDSKGCTSTATLTTSSLLTTTLSSKTDPVNPGERNGSITVTAGGGAGAPYLYSLDNVTYQSSNVFEGLGEGTYTIWAQDRLGCTSTTGLAVTLTDPQPVVLNASVIDISCYGLSDGSVILSATGGIPPFTYSRDGVNFLSISSFYDLSAGPHIFWAKDSKDNTSSVSVTIAMPAALSISITSQKDALCKGIANGEIAVQGSGGTGAYHYQLNSAVPQSTPVFSVPAGEYTIRISDANSCNVPSSVITIREPALAVSVSSVVTAVSCNSGNNGVITLTAANGTAPYEYKSDVTDWQTSTEINNLPAGVYRIMTRDNNGCEGSQSDVRVSEPIALALSLSSSVNVSCHGYSNGVINVSSSGGTGNVRYYISTAPAVPNSSGTFSGLSAGDYRISGSDDNNCTSYLDVHIDQPDVLALETTVTNVTCNGAASGKVVLSGNGGVGPYTYSVDNLNFNTTMVINALLAREYIFYTKDAQGCSTSASVTITEPTAITFTYAVTNALCNGGASGMIDVTASGGVLPYTYSVDGNPFQASNQLTGLVANTYIVSVMDGAGCIKTNSVYVGEAPALRLQLTDQQRTSCYGGSNGSLTVQAAGGTGGYQYSIDGVNHQSSATFSGLSANDYTVTVRDANNCTIGIPVTIAQPAELSLQVLGKIDILCAGAATGVLDLQANGGVGNYQYSLESNAYQTLGYYDHLTASNYGITVRDGNQCTKQFTVALIDLYAPLTATLDAVAPATCEDRGSITVTNVTGGLSPYGYSLDNSTYVTNPLFSNLYNGDYTVYIKDANGCTIDRSISPYGPVSLRGTVQLSPVSCYGGSNGSITVTNVSGGNNNYEYSLDGITYQSSAVFNNLIARSYQVSVRDIPYSCQTVITAVITSPAELNLRVINNQPVSCYDGNNGAIELQVSGGVGSNVFTIDGRDGNSTGIFNNLSGDTYTLEVTDGNSCTRSIPVTVTQPTLLTAGIESVRDISCYGLRDGAFSIAAGGGISPYVYSIGNNYQSSALFGNLDKGDYTIVIQDNNGCEQIVTSQIAEPDLVQITSITATDILCNGDASGELSITATGGVGAYAFTLNSLPSQQSNTFTHLSVGDYLLSIQDENGCDARERRTLSQPSRLQLTKTFSHPVCSYAQDGSMSVAVSGGVSPYTYSWNTGSDAAMLTDLGGGIYKVGVTDAHGCMIEDSALLIQPDVMQIDLGFKDTVLCVGQTITLNAGNPGATYSWVSDTGFNSTEQMVSINKDGYYTLTVRNPAGCVGTGTFSVQTSLTALTADFLLSSYGVVGDTVMLIDVSKPKPGINEWSLPAGARYVGSGGEGTIRELIFSEPGDYTITMYARLGECADAVSKTIRILPATQREETDSLLGYRPKQILSLTAYPNPNEGDFKVKIGLSKVASIQLRLISFNTGEVLDIKTGGGSKDYEVPFSIQQLPQGVYLLALQVEGEYQVTRILKM
jgi:hypothetical protein